MRVSKYSRKRIIQAFQTPTDEQKRKHSPRFDTVTWDKERVLQDTRNWPVGQINWSKFGREHNVSGKNAGQVVKEFCEMSGIDVHSLEGTATPRRRTRAKKKRLPGGEISAPTLPPLSAITKEIQELSEGGRFLLCEPCVPYTLKRCSTKNGVVQMYEIQVQGRKISLTDVKEKLLHQHEKYMRLLPDTAINSLSREEAQQVLKQMQCKVDDTSDVEQVREVIKKYQRSRTQAFWHDHGTVIGNSLILVTVHVVYDIASFLTSQEYANQSAGSNIDIQTAVEKPEIHMIAMGSSSSGIDFRRGGRPSRARQSNNDNWRNPHLRSRQDLHRRPSCCTIQMGNTTGRDIQVAVAKTASRTTKHLLFSAHEGRYKRFKPLLLQECLD